MIAATVLPGQVGWELRWAVGREQWNKVNRGGTVAMTVSSCIPGQIHRTFTRMRIGPWRVSQWLRMKNCGLGTGISTA